MTHIDESKDWARRPLSICLWLGLPVAIETGIGLLHLPFRFGAATCSALFLWMAAACVLNARRCHRLHCYIDTDLSRRAFGHMAGTDGPALDALRDEVAQLRNEVAELRSRAAELDEVQSRLDFAERMLAQRDRGILPDGKS